MMKKSKDMDQIPNTLKHRSRDEVEKILEQRFFGGEVSCYSLNMYKFPNVIYLTFFPVQGSIFGVMAKQ